MEKLIVPSLGDIPAYDEELAKKSGLTKLPLEWRKKMYATISAHFDDAISKKGVYSNRHILGRVRKILLPPGEIEDLVAIDELTKKYALAIGEKYAEANKVLDIDLRELSEDIIIGDKFKTDDNEIAIQGIKKRINKDGSHKLLYKIQTTNLKTGKSASPIYESFEQLNNRISDAERKPYYASKETTDLLVTPRTINPNSWDGRRARLAYFQSLIDHGYELSVERGNEIYDSDNILALEQDNFVPWEK